jgi:hypothetical protein
MEHSRVKDRVTKFGKWWDSGPWPAIVDARSRYRMEVKDREKREGQGLSVLGSTKSLAAVDHLVETALLEYHGDPDALSFVARAAFDIPTEEAARVLSEIFKYRAKRTFPFFTWHRSSLLAGGVDGIECCFVSWVMETYEKETGCRCIDTVSGDEVDPGLADHPMMKGRVKKEPVKQRFKSRDSFWYDLLEPGRDCMWDPNIPYMDINLGKWALVKLKKTSDELRALMDRGVLDLLTEEILSGAEKGAKTATDTSHADSGRVAIDPQTIDFDDANQTELWCYFERKASQWKVSFSIRGEIEASDEKDMNEVFYRGRPVNVLPLVVGLTKPRLWESFGYGIPNIIAPLEDEYRDHRNNVNDIAKEIVQGKYRIDPDANVKINDILNRRAFRANPGEVEFIKRDYGMLETLRATDALEADIRALVPSGINGAARNIVPHGTDQTLGATQIALHDQDEKTGVSLLTRNQTFLEKVLYVTGQMIISFESDETIMKLAGIKSNVQHLPLMQPTMQGPVPDPRQLDILFDVSINVGVGAVSRKQKAQSGMQIADWRKSHGIPTDFGEVAKFVNVSCGLDPDQFTPKTPPPPPRPEWEAKVEIPWSEIPDQAKLVMLQELAGGAVGGKATVKDDTAARLREAEQNGGGLMHPDRTGTHVDATGEAAARMGEAARMRGMGGSPNV